MNIEIIAVDKLRERYVREACALYEKRLRPIMPVTVHEIRSCASGNAKTIEGNAILRRADEDGILWALDQSGRSVTSSTLAALLMKAQRSGKRRLSLAIGGAAGLSKAVLQRADFAWALSELTFLHEMARLIVLEQLYRAAKINRGEPYHR